MRDVPGVSPPAVRARAVELAYGERTALEASDLVVPAGLITAVIGPNGAGKSTLFSAVAGLIEPRSGELEVLGRPASLAHRRVAYVLQATKVNEVMPVTVGEAVAMGRYAGLGLLGRFGEEDRAAVAGAMSRLEIEDLSGRHLHELSAGQRQRVFVAQGLAQDRDLLLLDEPLTGLDLVSREAILRVIAQERDEGRTVAFTTHDLSEAGIGDHVLLLAGRVITQGPPGEVLTPAHLSEAYGLQVVDIGPASLMVDDPAHLPEGVRHVHLDRSERLGPGRG